MVGKKHVRNLDIQMDSNEVLLCFKYHKKVVAKSVDNNSQSFSDLWCLLVKGYHSHFETI